MHGARIFTAYQPRVGGHAGLHDVCGPLRRFPGMAAGFGFGAECTARDGPLFQRDYDSAKIPLSFAGRKSPECMPRAV